jgi:membrane protein DedA with SNARE-associated domain/membrane-associated phospholipid phosphatase
VSLPAALAAAIAGAVIGDSVGYEIGKRWGRTLLNGTLGRIVKHEHLDRAERYLAERGGKAVFFGRFTAALRVLIPGMAGMAGLPYGTFARYNVAGGTLWAGGFVVAGFLAGSSYRRVEHVAKQAGLVLLVVAVLLGGAFYLARKLIRNRSGVQAFARRRLDRPWVRRVHERYRRQLDFLARRLRPGGALGLELTVALVALGLAGWLFGAVAAAVLASGRLIGIDQPVLDFFARHRSPALTGAFKAVSVLGSTAFIVPAAVVIGGLLAWRARSWRPVLVPAGAYGGSALLYGVVKVLVARPRPPVALAVGRFGGWSFPSGHATQAVAFYGALAYLLSGITPSWSRKVMAWTAAACLALLIGLSRCYLGAHWASDVAAGWTLGGLWLFAVVALSSVSRDTAAERPAPSANHAINRCAPPAGTAR